jgi:hypothetical protein
MARARKLSGANTPHSPYLTKRILLRAARQGIRNAADETMRVMGHTVIAHEGWIVKKFADGTIVRLKKISPQENTEVKLD